MKCTFAVYHVSLGLPPEWVRGLGPINQKLVATTFCCINHHRRRRTVSCHVPSTLNNSNPLGVSQFPLQALCCICLHPACFFSTVEKMNARGHFGERELMVVLALMRLGKDAYGVGQRRLRRAHLQRDRTPNWPGSLGWKRICHVGTAGGFVSSELGKPTAERGGRAKRYFRITANGVREVRRTQRDLRNLWNGLPQLEKGMG